MARISNREFVITWLHSDTSDQVAKTLGMSKAAATARAVELRKRGVKLPKKSARKSETERQLEVAQLNSLISKELKQAA